MNLSVALMLASYAVVLGVSLAGFQSWPPTIVAIAATANYMHERFQLCKIRKVDSQDRRIDALYKCVEEVVKQFQKLEAMNDDVRKQSEDVKKIVTQYNLKQAFGPKV